MRNILFLHSSSELYGSDRSLLNLIKNLDKSLYSIKVILPEDGPLVEKLKMNENVEVYIKEIATLRRKHMSIKGIFQYLFNFLTSLFFLVRIISRGDIDIVYTNTSVVFPGGIAAKLMRKKSVWHIREIIENSVERKVVSKVINLFSDIIIANSNATGDSITNNRNKLRVVYNAIENSETQVPKHKRLGKLKTNFIVGMAGRINRWKGQKFFVDMAERVLKENSKVEFLIAGDVYKGEEYILDDLKHYIESKGLSSQITLLGQVSNMNSFYEKVDIFILPSIQPEPFGLVILEAMEREIPVVATNHGGPVEIIEDNINGFLVNHKDSQQMSKVVLSLISDDSLRSRVGKEGREKRNRVFTISNYVKSITEIINEL
ncbi:TPA: glycosyltransferase [Yersinia enterocolitica]|nr:glycosyltransferase [Yersinia enterocolitica]